MILPRLSPLINKFSDHCFVFAGDFNVDLDKLKIHSRLLRDVCNDNDFRFATRNGVSSIDCTSNFNMNSFSSTDLLLSLPLFLNHLLILVCLDTMVTINPTMIRLCYRSILA
jgi:hypothetical protein